jgi:transcriptional regulator with XRE-family HTH domain
MNNEVISANLRSARNQLGKSQVAVAQEIGVSTGSYSLWERYGKLPRDPERQQKIVNVLGLTWSQLTEDKSVNIVAGLFDCTVYHNQNVQCIREKTVTNIVYFENRVYVKINTVAERPDGTFGLVVELKDANIEKYFIGIWWPNTEPYPKWYSLEKLKELNIKVEGRILSDT